MSTSKLDTSGIFQQIHLHTNQTKLSLAAENVWIRPNGIEFRSETAIPKWTEMTVDLFSGASAKKVHCTGVVVECVGNRHSGYHVSMLFMNLTRQAQERLDQMVFQRAH